MSLYANRAIGQGFKFCGKWDHQCASLTMVSRVNSENWTFSFPLRRKLFKLWRWMIILQYSQQAKMSMWLETISQDGFFFCFQMWKSVLNLKRMTPGTKKPKTLAQESAKIKKRTEHFVCDDFWMQFIHYMDKRLCRLTTIWLSQTWKQMVLDVSVHYSITISLHWK